MQNEILKSVLVEIQEMHKTLGLGLLKIQEALLNKSEVVVPAGTKINVNTPPEMADDAIENFFIANPEAKISDAFKVLNGPAYNRVEKIFKAVRAKVKAPAKEEKKPEPKKEEKAKVTIEALRAKISEFAEKFSMNRAMEVCEQFGGSRKVSKIPEVKYEMVFTEMDKMLQAGDAGSSPMPGHKAEEKPVAGLPSIDDVRVAAKPFIEQYGDPAFRELLGKFVKKGDEAKISKVPAASYAALIEALTNA